MGDFFLISVSLHFTVFLEVNVQFLPDLCYVEVTVCLNILQRILQQNAAEGIHR